MHADERMVRDDVRTLVSERRRGEFFRRYAGYPNTTIVWRPSATGTPPGPHSVDDWLM